MLLIIVVSFIIISVYVIINIIDEEFDLKDYIYFILIILGIFLGGIIGDYTKNSEVLNSIDTLVTYRDSVLLIFK